MSCMRLRTGTGGRGRSLVVWAATRAVLLLCVFKVSGTFTVPGPDVTSDVSGIYRGWYEVLRGGSYPLDDVTWQYPPAAALAILSPALLPFLEYASAFFVLVLVCDALTFGLLTYAGTRSGRRGAGAWVWVVGVPLLGPTVYARYDLMVTAVAVAALLAGVRRPRALGALAAFGALLKVWPVLPRDVVQRVGTAAQHLVPAAVDPRDVTR
ncbi:glycosyltransferase 87 family protein, partial [Streptomyces sp. NPDC005899]|uniref:glycosyltransferase 87 family protein n=1 Tax=Streptomyces sp. NPDC005899 TaxID=3155716 RepID=UPI0033E4AF22